ncbi:hypothetical protein BB561_006713 [Smittium simulii]|uniref:Uncharacterized protein n=1 Tax=Smittium simulii TaxID=133385 RepID=A0A2T9Y229_9FUNG|nr:hypothetical protein BB561_006713 [Smittium simulii]
MVNIVAVFTSLLILQSTANSYREENEALNKNNILQKKNLDNWRNTVPIKRQTLQKRGKDCPMHKHAADKKEGTKLEDLAIVKDKSIDIKSSEVDANGEIKNMDSKINDLIKEGADQEKISKEADKLYTSPIIAMRNEKGMLSVDGVSKFPNFAECEKVIGKEKFVFSNKKDKECECDQKVPQGYRCNE